MRKGQKHTEETKRKMSRIFSEETKQKMKENHYSKRKGYVNPMKGVKMSKESRMKISIAVKGRPNPNKGKRLWKNKKHPKGMLGKRAWNKGKYHSNETKEKISNTKSGQRLSEKHKSKISKSMKKVWKNPVFAKEMGKKFHVKPNNMEKHLLLILNQNFPNNWKYCGDYSFWINGRNPDFINTEQNKIIELFGDYWHEPNEEQERINHFMKHGFQTLVIWNKELKNEGELLRRLGDFCG